MTQSGRHSYCCVNSEHNSTSQVSESIVIWGFSFCERSSKGANVLIVVLFLNCCPTFTCKQKPVSMNYTLKSWFLLEKNGTQKYIKTKFWYLQNHLLCMEFWLEDDDLLCKTNSSNMIKTCTKLVKTKIWQMSCEVANLREVNSV